MILLIAFCAKVIISTAYGTQHAIAISSNWVPSSCSSAILTLAPTFQVCLDGGLAAFAFGSALAAIEHLVPRVYGYVVVVGESPAPVASVGGHGIPFSTSFAFKETAYSPRWFPHMRAPLSFGALILPIDLRINLCRIHSLKYRVLIVWFGTTAVGFSVGALTVVVDVPDRGAVPIGGLRLCSLLSGVSMCRRL